MIPFLSFKQIFIRLKSNAYNILFSICFFFRQVFALLSLNAKELLGGNADIFYIGGILSIYQNRKNIKRLKPILLTIGFLLLYATIQMFALTNITFIKLLINIVKISLCLLLALFVLDNYSKINIFRALVLITSFNIFFTVIALFFRNSLVFWTQNDVVNKYDLSRLKLFYLEPSELGFHIIVVIIFLLGYYVVTECCNQKRIIILSLCLNAIVLYFTKPLGAIGFGALAISILFLYDWIRNYSKKKTFMYILVLIFGLLIIVYMVISNNPIYLRFLDTLNGNDSSNGYRIKVAFSVMAQSLADTKGLGIGFGNMRTSTIFNQYSYLGLTTSLANSFPSFIIEGGIFAILFIVLLAIILIRSCIKSHSAVKWSLFTLLFTYQIFGGYFTSTLYWILYGLILSGFHENQINEQVEK